MINWPKQPEKDGGTRPLTSTHSVLGYESTLVSVQDIEWKLDSQKQTNREVKAQLEAFTQSVHDSIDQHGMRWPIILKDGQDKKYTCYIGNDRMAYAVENNYTHISAITVDNSIDKLKIVQRTRQHDALEGFSDTVS